MSQTSLDIRQSQTRTLQDQLNAASTTQMDSTLASINNELTVPGRLIAQATPSLVVTVGSGTVLNPNTSKHRVLPQVNSLNITFAGGTITLPSGTGGGSITVSPGTSATISIGASQFCAVLVQLTTAGQISLLVGSAVGTITSVVVPTATTTALALGYIIVQSNSSSVIQSVTNSMLYQYVGGGGSGGGGGTTIITGGGGDDIDSLNYSASFLEQFLVAPVTGGSVNTTSGFTNAVYNATTDLFAISYDASKIVTATGGTSISVSGGTPTFTVAVGDILIVAGVARKITTVSSQVLYIIESAFPTNPVSAASCISQAVHTADLNNFTGTGTAVSAALTDTVSQMLLTYADNATSGSSNVPSFSTPNVSWSASSDASSFSTVQTRVTAITTQNSSILLPTTSTGLFLRFFSSATSGSGTVSLLGYHCFFHYKAQSNTASPNFANLTLNTGILTVKQQTSTPTSPLTGYSDIYAKSDGNFYTLNSAGNEIQVGSGGGGSKNYLSAYLPSTNTTANPGNGNFEAKTAAGWSVSHAALASGVPTPQVAGNTYATNAYTIALLTTGAATAGAVYNDGAHNFTVLQSITSTGTLLVVSGPAAPASGGPALSKVSGTGPTSYLYNTFTNSIPSTNLSINAVTVNPLAGTASGSLVSTAASAAGDMLLSSPFFIDIEDQAKTLQVKFYYEVVVGATGLNFSGTSSNSFSVWLYDNTNGAWIQPAGVFNLTQNSGVGYCTATFQTTSNSTEYQLAIINSNASTAAYTLYVDDFSVGPQIAPTGAAVSDWVSYTPTLAGVGTATGVAFRSRRVGDSLQVQGFYITGTPAASPATVTIGYGGANANVAIDSTKIAAFTAIGPVGLGGASTSVYSLLAFAPNATNANFVNLGLQGPAVFAIEAVNGNSFGTGTPVSMFFEVPIVGWSSNTTMSADTDTRVVAARAKVSGSLAVSPTTPINFDTVVFDTHGAITTGVGTWTYRVPVAGIYEITASNLTTAAAAASFYVYKNAVQDSTVSTANTANVNPGTAVLVKCNAGDTLDLRSDGSPTLSSAGSGLFNQIYIKRLTGPSVVAATESVNCRYTNSTTAAVPTSATVFNFPTKTFDTHSAVAVGSSWTFTAPVSGKYIITTTGSANSSVINQYTVTLNKNGATYVTNIFTQYAAANFNTNYSVNDTVQLNAGDTLSLLVNASAAATFTGFQFISIARIGN